MTESGTWAYRVRVTREQIVETAYTALAIEVADSRAQFREVVFGSRIDAGTTSATLPTDAQEILDQAIARKTYTETAPLSESFDTVLEASVSVLSIRAQPANCSGTMGSSIATLYVSPPTS